MSATSIMRRVADTVIEFGLDRSPLTPAGVREMARTGAIEVSWEPERVGRRSSQRPLVRLSVVFVPYPMARVETDTGRLDPADAKHALDFARTVAALAERIEAIR